MSKFYLYAIILWLYTIHYKKEGVFIKNYKKRIGSLICVFGLITSTLFSLTGCSSPNTTYSKNNIYFDTIIQITVYDKDDVSAIDKCFEMAATYENMFSRTIEDSDVSKINNADGEFVEVHEDTIELLEYGLKYCELSCGAFDITVGALSDTWDFKNNTGIIPDEDLIAGALDTVDYHNIVIQGNTVALTNPNAMIDLGAIAKGYIADKMKECLLENGVSSAIINLGGNVLLVGSNTDGSKFQIGIQKPFDETGTAIAAVEIQDCSLVSSGIYERYFELDNTIYHHLLNTDTGYPIENGLYGVTIISEKSVDGDALSTTVFALGLEDGMALIESLENTEAIFVTDEMEIISSSGIGRSIPFRIIE